MVQKTVETKYLKNIPLRMYTDFDVEWLIQQRHRDLYH
jgi:uncharacterized protein YlaI